MPEPDLSDRSAAPIPPAPSVLDHAAWASLTGPHARFAEVYGGAARYGADFAPFWAVDPKGDPSVWADLVELAGPAADVWLPGALPLPPDGWEVLHPGRGVQMVAVSLEGEVDPEAVRLGAGDVPDMLALIERTKPGPFRPRTVELGAYYGIRRAGTLVAMAGERMSLPGWVEISAVCTEAEWRGQGLATRLVRTVAAGIFERGDRAVLHANPVNTGAIRLYESIGFEVRRRDTFMAVRTPGASPCPP